MSSVFTVTRVLDAPRDLVWKVHAEPEHLGRWWGPKGCTLNVMRDFAFRPGGMFHYEMAFRNGASMWGRFIYLDLKAPERMESLVSFSNPDGGITRAPFSDKYPLEVRNVVTLTGMNGKTTLAIVSRPFGASPDEQAFFDSMHDSMNQGYNGTLDQLAEYLAKF
jgi:uncharacterized protein YndB with AHSA1/START domain